MTDQPTPTPLSLGEQLGLGAAWQPATASWELHPLTATDGSSVVALVLRTVGGSMGAVFTADNLRELVRQASEQLSGLAIPPAGLVLPPNGTNGNRAQRRHPR